MATVIDALLVTLGLDASAFKTGTIEAAKQQSKLENLLKKDSKERTELDKKAADAQKKRAEQFEKQGKHAAETFGKIRDHALGLIAVLAGGVGIAEFGKEMITGAANVKRLADNLGMHSRQVQAWQSSLKAVGGTAQSASNMLLTMSDSMTALHTSGMGPTSQMSAMQKFGINPGATNNAATGLLRVSRYLSALYKIHPNEAREHAAEMGFDESQFNLLKHYYALKKKLAYYEVHPVYTKAQEQQAVMMQTKLVQFGNSVKRVATAIAYQFLPIFQKLLVKLQGWANWAMSHQSQIVGWVDVFVAGLTKLGIEINKGVQWFGGWKDVLLTLAGLKLASMIAGFGQLAWSIGLVATSLARVAGLGGAAKVLSSAAGAAAGGATLAGGLAVLAGGGAMLYSQDLDVGEESALNHAEKRAAMMSYLQRLGYGKAGSAAIAANFNAESGLNPDIQQPNGPGYGLAQWGHQRQALFQKMMGRPIQGSSMAQQLTFANWEFKTKYPAAYAKFMAAKTASEKSAIFTKYYEAPANLQSQTIKRQALANEYYNDPTVRMAVPRVSAAASAPVRAATVINHHNRSAASVVNQNSSEAHIGQVVVHTNSQDPADHGRLLAQAFRRYTTVDAINSGVL
ncbi:phage tail tip lysozyme [Acidithiobacillus thiooxidans]|jgi:hypothetical protein|uniref:phage tail tip lysozyme n=1 Tax=Acidithiobacillus thiooxidans TaxID=930 RepID=UPI001C074983|nr:phage tail tip lysozyme [Acidithiobacillus thiooxidans]MBU2841853.1 hypothetical protein [Acidithiobacillus thiooxidans]